MPRTARASIGGICYHVLNRGNARQDVFHEDDDHQRFIELIQEPCARLAEENRAPHGPGIHAATPPSNRGKKVECPLLPLLPPLFPFLYRFLPKWRDLLRGLVTVDSYSVFLHDPQVALEGLLFDKRN